MIQARLQQLQSLIPGAVLHGDAAFCWLEHRRSSRCKRAICSWLCVANVLTLTRLAQVQAAGAVALVVNHLPEGISGPALVVPDTKLALLAIAKFWRQQFAIPVIESQVVMARPPSKKMIASILLQQFGEVQMIATKGNLNNESVCL